MTESPRAHCTITLFKTFSEDALEQRVRGEYRDMPGMRLTLEQAMRMWDLDRDTCTHVLASLVGDHYLEIDRTGRYTRAHADY